MNKTDNIVEINTVKASSHNCRVANTYARCSTPGQCDFEDLFDTIEICKNCNKHK